MYPLNCVSTGGAWDFSESIIHFFGPLSVQPYVPVRWPGLTLSVGPDLARYQEDTVKIT